MGRVVVRRNFGSGAKLSKFAHSYHNATRRTWGKDEPVAQSARMPIKSGVAKEEVDVLGLDDQRRRLAIALTAWRNGEYFPNSYETGFLCNIEKSLKAHPLSAAQDRLLHNICIKVEATSTKDDDDDLSFLFAPYGR